MATWAHTVCDAHGAFLLKPVGEVQLYMNKYNRVFPTGGMGSPPYKPKIC